MKISYNWLKQYIQTDLSAEETGELLTGCGLEVENIEKFESLPGGLKGMVIGEVKEKIKHPNADKLSLTKVDIGAGTLLSIVCGAPNVEAGQKVVVATVGSMCHPAGGEPFEIKKSKIRGELSEGMICAEDEIGIGKSHAGIMVLDSLAKVGQAASEYFKIESDSIFEIGLTPNRADAASHFGVARDLAAATGSRKPAPHPGSQKAVLPSVDGFKADDNSLRIEVEVKDQTACPRYSGVTVSGIKVAESPAWLKTRLQSVGIRPINNIVDVTNFVLHETGQPLHAFDSEKIKGNRIIVQKMKAGTVFKTLDGVDRKLSGEDLMICNSVEGMCIAGIFGGEKSGVSETTTSVFIESATFDAVHIRKSSKFHGLKTDASFRFERGTDPNMTVYALKRAALLIKEIAGGKISSEISDFYPNPVEHFKVAVSYANINRIAGKELEKDIVKKILLSLDIAVQKEGNDGLLLSVPPFRVDVKRECDIAEEVLRIYGYNNIEEPETFRSSLSAGPKPDKEQLSNKICDMLSANGFREIFTNSLTQGNLLEGLSSFDIQENINLLNPLSSELGSLRQTLLFSGLEVIAYNRNRKQNDLRLFELGKVYKRPAEKENKFLESEELSLFITGRKIPESWNSPDGEADIYQIKSFIARILGLLSIDYMLQESFPEDILSSGQSVFSGKNELGHFGEVNPVLLKKFDIETPVYYTKLDWTKLTALAHKKPVMFTEVPKFPEVRRDLALLIDRNIHYSQLETIAYETEKKLLRSVNLFDVYAGEKTGKDKKSYALSFILQDENATLTDKQVEKVMERLINAYREKLGAEIRQ